MTRVDERSRASCRGDAPFGTRLVSAWLAVWPSVVLFTPWSAVHDDVWELIVSFDELRVAATDLWAEVAV
jgi:hypothetical protein